MKNQMLARILFCTLALAWGPPAGAGEVLAVYEADGLITEISAPPGNLWIDPLTVGEPIELRFTLSNTAEEGPAGVYRFAVWQWSIFTGAGSLAQVNHAEASGMVTIAGDSFTLEDEGALVSPSGVSTGGITLEYNALGLTCCSGLRPPSASAQWTARLLDPNGVEMVAFAEVRPVASSTPRSLLALSVLLAFGAIVLVRRGRTGSP